MRSKLTKQSKIMLIFLVVLLSFLYAKTGSSLRQGDSLSNDLRRIERDFRNANNQTKHEIQFGLEDLGQFIHFIDRLENEFNASINILQRVTSQSGLIHLIEVNNEFLNEFLAQIRSYETDNIKRELSSQSPDIYIDLNERLEINEALRRSYLDEIQRTRPSQNITRLQAQLNAVQMTIDSLNLAIREQQHHQKNALLLLNVSQSVSGTKNMMNFTKQFTTRFIIMFIGLIVAILMIFLLSNFVLWIMSAIGIHTASGKGKGYQYEGYGDRRIRRKIKKENTKNNKDEIL